MKSQDVTSEIVVEFKLAMEDQVGLSERSAWIASHIPDCNRALDTDLIVLGPRPLSHFTVDRHAVEPRSLSRIDAAVLLVSRFPFREPELLPDVVLADERIIAR